MIGVTPGGVNFFPAAPRGATRLQLTTLSYVWVLALQTFPTSPRQGLGCTMEAVVNRRLRRAGQIQPAKRCRLPRLGSFCGHTEAW